MAIIADVFSFSSAHPHIQNPHIIFFSSAHLHIHAFAHHFFHPHICTSTHSHIIFHTYYLSTNAVIWGIFRTFEGYCFYHI